MVETNKLTAKLLKLLQDLVCFFVLELLYKMPTMSKGKFAATAYNLYHEELKLGTKKETPQIPAFRMFSEGKKPFDTPAVFDIESGDYVTPETHLTLSEVGVP